MKTTINHKIHNKKAIGFLTMITPVILILFIFLILTLILPVNVTKKDLDYNTTILVVDNINAKIPAENFYKKEETIKTINTAKKDFAKTLGLSLNDLSKRTQGGDDSNYLGCKIQGIELWYNEKNLDVNMQNNDSHYSNCSAKFNDEFIEKYKYFLEDRLFTNLQNGLKEQNINSNPIINIDYDKEIDSIDLQIKTSYKEQTKIGDLNLELNYNTNHTLGLYPQLLIGLNNLIPQLSTKIEEEIPKCLENNENTELKCITNITENYLNNFHDKILQEYNLEIKYLDIQSDNYYGLNFIVSNNNNIEELNFGVILKDNIPYSYLNFNLNHFQGLDKTIELHIEKPRFYDKVKSYVILYSYENFFDKSSSNYDQITNLLRKNKIPTDFENTGISENNNQYFFSKDFNKPITLITTSDKTFIKDANDKEIKKIKLSQIYNKDTETFELLEEKPIFVYVFATDQNLNYNVENIEGKTKKIIPQNLFGPSPITINNHNTITGEEEGYQNTLILNIEDYEDPSFNHYDLYILEKGELISEQCIDTTSNKCHYYDGSDSLKEPQDINLIVTSDVKIQNDNKYNHIIESQTFTNNLILENEKDYDIYIIPMNNQKHGLIKPLKKQWNFKKIVNDDLTFYQLIKDNTDNIIQPAKFSAITIKDKKPPHPYNSIKVNGIRKKNENGNEKLYLNWNEINSDNNILELEGELVITYNDKQPKTIQKIVGKDGNLLVLTTNMETITYKNIIPIDMYGNKNNEYNDVKHSATYSRN